MCILLCLNHPLYRINRIESIADQSFFFDIFFQFSEIDSLQFAVHKAYNIIRGIFFLAVILSCFGFIPMQIVAILYYIQRISSIWYNSDLFGSLKHVVMCNRMLGYLRWVIVTYTTHKLTHSTKPINKTERVDLISTFFMHLCFNVEQCKRNIHVISASCAHMLNSTGVHNTNYTCLQFASSIPFLLLGRLLCQGK